MAGPRPDDPYTPNNSVSPSGPPSDYLNVRADPNAFGAQIGQQTQVLGKTLENVGQQGMDVAVQAQGLANEHAATMAEQQFAIEGGKIYDQYKNLEGLDAANAKDEYVQKYVAVSNKIREGLNPAAARAYDQMATRRLSFTIQDMNSYSANETKKAYRTGDQSMIKLAQDQASRYDVATNPSQLGFELSGITFALNRAFTAPKYGKYQSITATSNKDGTLSFDQSTDEGRIAQADYDNELSIARGTAFENAAYSIAFDAKNHNVAKSVDFITQYRDKMPAATYQKISARLEQPFRNEQAHTVVENSLADAHSQYLSDVAGGNAGPVYATNIGNVKLADGSFANPTTPVDGVTLAVNNLREKYQGLTLAQIGAKWTGEDPQKVADWVKNASGASGISPGVIPDLNNPQVLQALMKGVAVAEKSQDQRKAFSDDVIAQGIQASLSGQKANLSQGIGINQTLSGKAHQNEVDWLGDHEADLIASVRKQTADAGGDVQSQDLAAGRMEARINELRSAQQGEVRSLTNSLFQKVMDPDHPITNPNFLDNNPDPQVRTQWIRLQSLDSFKANSLLRSIEANARGKSHTYGTDFYTHLIDGLTGKIGDISAIQDYVGDDKFPISTLGLKQLKTELDSLQTPQGQGFAHREVQFLESMRGKVTGTSILPGIDPAIHKADFDKQLMAILPQIQAKRADLERQGRDPAEMFDEKFKDYIGKNIKPLDFDAANKALLTSTVSGVSNNKPVPMATTNPGATQINNPKPEKPLVFTKLEDLGVAYQSGKISKEEVDKILDQHPNWLIPSVPRPQ